VKDGALHCGDVGGVGHPVGQSLPGLAGPRMGCQSCGGESGVTPNSYGITGKQSWLLERDREVVLARQN